MGYLEFFGKGKKGGCCSQRRTALDGRLDVDEEGDGGGEDGEFGPGIQGARGEVGGWVGGWVSCLYTGR